MSSRLTQDEIDKAQYEYSKQWDSPPYPGDSQFGEYLYELKAAIAEAQRKHSDREWVRWLMDNNYRLNVALSGIAINPGNWRAKLKEIADAEAH